MTRPSVAAIAVTSQSALDRRVEAAQTGVGKLPPGRVGAAKSQTTRERADHAACGLGGPDGVAFMPTIDARHSVEQIEAGLQVRRDATPPRESPPGRRGPVPRGSVVSAPVEVGFALWGSLEVTALCNGRRLARDRKSWCGYVASIRDPFCGYVAWHGARGVGA
jgi:hypothetical protein